MTPEVDALVRRKAYFGPWSQSLGSGPTLWTCGEWLVMVGRGGVSKLSTSWQLGSRKRKEGLVPRSPGGASGT